METVKYAKLEDFIVDHLNPEVNKTAFFFGNGINNYCESTNSWKNILISLGQDHINDKADFSKILADHSVSYPEFFDLIQFSNKNNFHPSDFRSIKKQIVEGIDKWKPQNIHAIWTNKLINLNRPLLTSNFDYMFERSNNNIIDFIKKNEIGSTHFKPLTIKDIEKRKEFNYYYPWSSYYSYKEIKNPINEFAIWHIHGVCEYIKSIRLGLTDYMGIVEKARKLLLKSNGNPFNRGGQSKLWIGNTSWLDIFFNSNLVFIGIGLDVQETSLRWLLIEREKLYCKFPAIRKKTWFIYNRKYDRMEQGKQLFFEKLKIDIIEGKDSRQIYNTMPQLIN